MTSAGATREILFVASMDTESDAWDATREPRPCSNLRQVPGLVDRLAALGVRLTVLPTHLVSVDDYGAGLLQDLEARDDVEVGAHLHPWTSPPLDEPLSPDRTMMCNLSEELQHAKLRRHTDHLTELLGRAPTSFRAGRWALGPSTARAVIACGYRVDSSVTPWRSWAQWHGPDFAGAPMDVYRIDGEGPVTRPAPGGPLVELPPSSGFSRRPFHRMHQLRELAARRPVSWLRLRGLAARAGLLEPIFMSPETASGEQMATLARQILATGTRYVHVMWHSQSLVPGLGPFVTTAAEADRFMARLETLLTRLAGEGSVRFCTLGEAADRLAPSP